MRVNTNLPGPSHTTYDITPPLSPTQSDIQQSSTLCPTAASKRWKYLRRILRFQQMDFQYAMWQMFYLFISPQKVYRNFHYRKQSKNQWARDDPAFLVLLSLMLCVTSVLYAVILRMTFLGFISFTLWTVFVDCIGSGVCVASLCWFIANKYFLVSPKSSERVEWGYCFDVHLNALFPWLVILHGIGAAVYVLAIGDGILRTFLGNTLLLISFSYYVYITFLGYDALPILRKTKALLFPFTILAIVYVVTVIMGWNIAQVFHLYNLMKHGAL